MSRHWTIIQTKAAAEEIAERSLQQHGYRVYLPRFRKLLSPHGRERRQAMVMRPLFPGVLFAQDWRGWPISPVVGVAGLMLARPGVPARLAEADVELIMLRERAGDFDEVWGSGQRTDLRPGDQVQVDINGSQVLAVLEHLSGQGRAVVKMLLFGNLVTTELAASSLSRR